MKNKYIKINEADAEMIIREYDSDLDGNLNYDEFCQMALPATNPSLRQLALMRNHSYYQYRRPQTYEIENMVCNLLDNELRLVKRREDVKRELLKRKDFIKVKAFDEISKGSPKGISLLNLVEFLEANGFYPRRDDLEAILRRCDHSGDHHLNYDEFSEVTSVNQYSLTPEDEEEKRL